MSRRLVCTGVLAVLTSAMLLPLLARARETPLPKEPTKDPKSSVAGKVRISDIIIWGNQRLTTEEIKACLRTHVGDEYNSAKIDEDVRQLGQTHHISIGAAMKEEDGPARVKIYFTVCEFGGKVQKVTFRGAKHLKEDELRNLADIHPGMPLCPYKNKAVCSHIAVKYMEMGRPYATCRLIKGGDINDTEVVYQITEGPKAKVRDIQFTGNTFVSSARLAAKMHLSSRWFHLVGGPYSWHKAESDLDEVTKYFRTLGFDDVKVSLETQHSSDGSEVTMIFHIQEGQRYRAANGDQPPPFDHCSSGNILTVNRKQAYLGAAPQPEKKKEERPQARVGQVFIIGNTRTRQNVILRQVPLYPSEILKYSDITVKEKPQANDPGSKP